MLDVAVLGLAGAGAADRRRCSASIIERLMLKRIYHLDHLYGFLLTFGLALIIEGLFQWKWGSSGAPYPGADHAAAPISASCSCRPTALVRRRGGARDLPRHLVRHRAHPARRLPARGDRESRPWCAPSASTCRA